MPGQVYKYRLIDDLQVHLLLGALFFIAIGCSPYLIDNYTPAKWIIFYCVAVLGLFIQLFSKRGLLLPKSSYLLIFTILLAATYLLSMLVNFNDSYQSYYLDWLSFGFFVILTYTIFLADKSAISTFTFYYIVATIAVVTYGLLQYFGIEFFPLTRTNFSVSFFGHQNYTAEFVGSSVIVQVLAFSVCQKMRAKIPLFFLIILSLGYLFILSCRGAMVALFLGFIPLFFYYKKLKIKGYILFIIGATIATIVVIKFASVNFVAGFDLSKHERSYTLLDMQLYNSKKLSSNVRLATWANSLGMVRDNPLGLGPGNFEFSYTPYRKYLIRDTEESEFAVKDSPHNGYIEAIIENGWLFGVLLPIFCLILLIKLFKVKIENEHSERIKWLSLSVLIFFMGDAVFAFPMNNTFPFYAIAIILGMAFSILWPKNILVPFTRCAISLLLIVVLSLSVRYTIAKVVEFRPEYESMALSCKLFPENWHVCLEQAQIDYEHGYFAESQEILFKMLERQPNNFPAIWMVGLNYYAQGNIKRACDYFLQYNKIMDGDVADKQLINECLNSS